MPELQKRLKEKIVRANLKVKSSNTEEKYGIFLPSIKTGKENLAVQPTKYYNWDAWPDAQSITQTKELQHL